MATASPHTTLIPPFTSSPRIVLSLPDTATDYNWDVIQLGAVIILCMIFSYLIYILIKGDRL